MIDCKTQIINAIPNNNCCGLSFVKTVLFGSSQLIDGIILVNAQQDILNKFSDIVLNFYPELNINIWENYLSITGKTYRFTNDIDYGLPINPYNLEECDKLTTLKTIFLLFGKLYFVNDANQNSKGYNLEFVLKENLYSICATLLKEYGYNLKTVTRQNNKIIYTKNSGVICDLLVKLGAVYASFEIQNNLAMREMRNSANRLNNCFDSNLDKTLTASAEQLRAVNYIIDNFGIDYLDENLKEVALARIANPDVSLGDLKIILKDKISRAGIKYRLDKIISIYKNLKGEK